MLQFTIKLMCSLMGHHQAFSVWSKCKYCKTQGAQNVTVCPNCGIVRQEKCSICRKG